MTPAARAAVAVLAALAVLATACAGTSPAASAGSSSSTAALPATAATTTTTTVVATTTRPPVTTTTVPPGRLPQTHTKPPLGSALRSRLMALWDAIVRGSEQRALPLFFPKGAYLRMKAGLLSAPAADYADRLLGFYRLDLAAYHRALAARPARPRLLGVNASAADASWIPPGSCENLIGYWHLPGARLVYQQAGAVRSFAVASLISWRGVWYVVHLGPNPRPVDVGTVDQPAAGPGTPGPAGGC